jgi:hypothetical protein
LENDEICVIKKRHSVPDYVFAERLQIAMRRKWRSGTISAEAP